MPGQNKSRQFYVRDRITGTKYLIDTGADVSVIPVSKYGKQQTSDFSLEAANKSVIHTYGQKSLMVM